MLKLKEKSLREFLQIHHKQNADINLLEARVIISATYLFVTLEYTLHVIQSFLTNRDENPRTPGCLSFETKHYLLVHKKVFGSQSNHATIIRAGVTC